MSYCDRFETYDELFEGLGTIADEFSKEEIDNFREEKRKEFNEKQDKWKEEREDYDLFGQCPNCEKYGNILSFCKKFFIISCYNCKVKWPGGTVITAPPIETLEEMREIAKELSAMEEFEYVDRL
jgi:hypothetical protein